MNERYLKYYGSYKNYREQLPLEQKRAYVDKFRFSNSREAVILRDKERCVSCGMTREEHKERWDRDITVDHIDGQGRYSKTKNNDLNNLQTLCLSCHGKKDIIRRIWRTPERNNEQTL